MTFPYPRSAGGHVDELYKRGRRQDTNRDLGQSSMSPGDGMFEARSASGQAVAGWGDLPDNTFGVGLLRNGTFKNVNAWFYDTGQVDAAFTQRDQRLDQKDANDASHQGQLNTLRGDITRLDGVDASIGQQLGDRPTYSVFNGAVSSLSGRVDGAQATANGAQSAANAAQGAANAAQGTANSGVSAAGAAQRRADDAYNYAREVYRAAVAYAEYAAKKAAAGEPIPAPDPLGPPIPR